MGDQKFDFPYTIFVKESTNTRKVGITAFSGNTCYTLHTIFIKICIERCVIMLSKEKINRINELSAKSKNGTLTEAEAKERTALRKEYLDTFRATMRDTIENVKVVDPEGNDVTPEKVKQAKKNKFLN